MAAARGLEPRTHRLTVCCSTDWAKRQYNERCFPYLRPKILFDKAVFCSARAPNSSCRAEEFTALTINLQPFSDPSNIGDWQPGADFIPVFSEVQRSVLIGWQRHLWTIGTRYGNWTRASALKGLRVDLFTNRAYGAIYESRTRD